MSLRSVGKASGIRVAMRSMSFVNASLLRVVFSEFFIAERGEFVGHFVLFGWRVIPVYEHLFHPLPIIVIDQKRTIEQRKRTGVHWRRPESVILNIRVTDIGKTS